MSARTDAHTDLDAGVVAICGSKDCRGWPEHDQLTAAFGSADVPCQVVDSRCLDICKGPVVVVGRIDERPLVFRKVRGRKQRRDLVALAAGGPITDRLRSLRVTGNSARRAIARVRPR
jgi:hypothetical protein